MCGCGGRKNINVMQMRLQRQRMMQRKAAQVNNVTLEHVQQPQVQAINPVQRARLNKRRIGNVRRFPFLMMRR